MEEHYCTLPASWSLAPRYAGREQCKPGHGWTGIRDHFLLHYVISGEGTIRVGNRRFPAGAGDVFMFQPDTLMDYQASRAAPWAYTWVGYTGPAAAEATNQIGAGDGQPIISLGNGHRIGDFMGDLVESLRNKAPGFQLRAAGLTNLVLSEIVTFSEHRPEGKAPLAVDTESLVHQAESFIEQNYNRYIEVADIVAYIGLDRSYLGRRFKELKGMTLQQCLERRRMDRAHELIEGTTLPFIRVASSVGYRSYEVFERAFRRIFGLTPRDARASAADSDEFGGQSNRGENRQKRERPPAE